MEVFRRAILEPGPPENFALSTVQEVIKPQKQTKLAQDENQLLENILRALLQELVAAAVQSGEPIMQHGQSVDYSEIAQGNIPRLLDIVLYLCEKEHIEGGMIFQLLEDLTEMSTMRNCKDIFGYIESKQDILGKQELFARGKLVMLRTCNQLLRRLSKANDVVFCGRILMFLAHFFPLSERSAVNIKGVFNTSNETSYEKDPPAGISVDFNFYRTFWSLQECFCNPPSLMNAPTKWQKFTSSLMVVLSTFEAQPLSDEEGDAINMEEEAANFGIKYLTSSKLMGLELKDPSFRRHILVQCLIVFDYLRSPGKNEKDLPSESMQEEINSCEDRVKKLLEMTPPRGKDFLNKIEHILEREKNWVWWKRDGCPPFEKQPMEKKTVQDGTRKRRPRWRLGNKELSQLWKWADQNPAYQQSQVLVRRHNQSLYANGPIFTKEALPLKDTVNALTDPQRVRTPAVMEYWKPLAEDMDVSAGIEDDYHHKNNRVYCWKGLRISARQDLEGFSRFTDHGIEGVVPLELLPPDVRSKYQAKPNERSKRAKKEETKITPQQAEENQIATPASEVDGEGTRGDLEAAVTPMDTDPTTAVAVTDSRGATPMLDEHLKQGSDTDIGPEPGQLEAEADAEAEAEAEAEVEAGTVDGETDAEVDLDTVG